jgi:uncharacterized protein (DUF1778 family)
MALSLRINEKDAALIRSYAALKGRTVSEVVREAILERIEDEFDLKLYEKSLAEYKANPVSYSQEELEKGLGMR